MRIKLYSLLLGFEFGAKLVEFFVFLQELVLNGGGFDVFTLLFGDFPFSLGGRDLLVFLVDVFEFVLVLHLLLLLLLVLPVLRGCDLSVFLLKLLLILLL